jgi:hypothetical protein
MKNKQAFWEWFHDGNVIQFKEGYATQCAQYRNRIQSLPKLYRYFLKEFIYL